MIGPEKVAREVVRADKDKAEIVVMPGPGSPAVATVAGYREAQHRALQENRDGVVS